MAKIANQKEGLRKKTLFFGCKSLETIERRTVGDAGPYKGKSIAVSLLISP